MNSETIHEPTIPEWLCASDLWKSIHTCSDSETVEGEHRIIPLELRDLPVCELDCGDPILLYKVMGAWCLPWCEAPLVVFFPMWMSLDKKIRVSIIDQYQYFKDELGLFWYKTLCARDDDYLVAVLLLNNISVNKFRLMEYGSVKCLQRVASFGNWSYQWGNMYECLIGDYPGIVANALLLIKLLHKKEVLDSRIGLWAAKHGHLDCLQYSFESGIPLHETTCILAITHGNLPCLRYAVEHGICVSVLSKGGWVTFQLNNNTGRIEVIPNYTGNKYNSDIRNRASALCWSYLISLEIYDVQQTPVQLIHPYWTF